ncbi:hypothetical protein M758_1G325900 [Ceratodon purpureus]|uniref:Secreted protein n=1 Tax=Ceratodon purpureus TaxID=3225 RepID=A0A8T0JES4_CERPU|nr:hypothetical protein KC19_1G333600 [Ceratodon purpureus]KAG0632406.1 hypothetical protein M758_1G325900 [Ceratodon purpureus]
MTRILFAVMQLINVVCSEISIVFWMKRCPHNTPWLCITYGARAFKLECRSYALSNTLPVKSQQVLLKNHNSVLSAHETNVTTHPDGNSSGANPQVLLKDFRIRQAECLCLTAAK